MTPLDWIDYLYDSVSARVYWTSAVGMLLITVIEKFVFAFHPLEKNIFLD